MRKIVPLLLSLSFGITIGSSQKLFTGPGDFSDNTRWNGNTLPVAGDDLSIRGTCTFDNGASSIAYGYLSLGQGGTSGALQWPVGGTNTLSVTTVGSVVSGSQLDMTNGGTLQIRTSWNATNMTFTPGSGTIHWNDTSGNSTLPAGVAAYNNLKVEVEANAATLGVGTTVAGTLTLTSGTLAPGTFTIMLSGGAKILRERGSLGTVPIFDNSVDVTYMGSSAVTTGAELPTSATNLNNLIINNSGGVTLGAGATVNGTLTLTSGKLALGSFNLTASAVSGGSVTSYVATTGTGGLIRTVGATDVLFPVGPAASYDPVVINNSGATDDFTVSVQTSFTNPPYSTAHVDRQWTITEGTAGGSNATITLQWNSSDESGTTFSHGNPVFIGRYDGSQWVQTLATLGGSDPYTATASGFTTFSPFGVGNEGALPVQLAQFNAVAVGEHTVNLYWSTISETNNYGFEVQKSVKDREHFETIAGSFTAGHGTTLKSHQYSYTDVSATLGIWYYRLRQIDLDGTVHYSEGVRVSVLTDVQETAPARFALMQNYPNPFNPETQITFTVEPAERATLRVFNLLGQEVATLFDGPAEPGRYYRLRFAGAGLPTGTYMYRLNSGKKVATMRMVLLK